MPFFGMMIFFAVFAVFAVVIIKGISEWSANNKSPVETLNAVVVAKRTQVSGGGSNTMASTTYYITFEYEDGQRQEFRVKAGHYGITAEGDRGVLTRQGTRILSFERRDDVFKAADPKETVHKCSACGATYRGAVCEYCGTPAPTESRWARRR